LHEVKGETILVNAALKAKAIDLEAEAKTIKCGLEAPRGQDLATSLSMA